MEFPNVRNMIDRAHDHGSKYPKITLVSPTGNKLVLKRVGSGPNAGAINLTDGKPYGESDWYGRIELDGSFTESRHPWASRVADFLKTFDDDPSGVAKAQGDLLSACCFCGIALTDQRSISEGYGPICADKFGLPWGAGKIDRTYEVDVEGVRELENKLKEAGKKLWAEHPNNPGETREDKLEKAVRLILALDAVESDRKAFEPDMIQLAPKTREQLENALEHVRPMSHTPRAAEEAADEEIRGRLMGRDPSQEHPDDEDDSCLECGSAPTEPHSLHCADVNVKQFDLFFV